MDVSKILKIASEQLQLSFTLKNKNISLDEVFDKKGLLPAIAKRANQLSEFCFNQELGLKFTPNEESLVGSVVEIKPKTSNSFVLLCFLDVIIQIIKKQGKASEYALDELLFD